MKTTPPPHFPQVWSRLCPPQPGPIRPRQKPAPPPRLHLVYAGGGAPCHTPTNLALLQQPAGAHNVTVFQGIVCVGGKQVWGVGGEGERGGDSCRARCKVQNKED